MSRVTNCSQKEMAVASAAPRYPNPAPQDAAVRVVSGPREQIGGRGGKRRGVMGVLFTSYPLFHVKTMLVVMGLTYTYYS